MIVQADALALPLADASVDLVVTSPPYFALRNYQDGGAHLDGQVGAEPTPTGYLDALVAATAEMVRVLKTTGSIFVNLGDKYAGSGGHNNAGVGGAGRGPSRYNQNGDGIPTKSLMGLPWRYAIRCVDELGLVLRAELIWAKPNGMPESVKDRVRRTHETWFHFVKATNYFADIEALRRPYAGDRAPTRRVKHPGAGKHKQRAAAVPNPAGSLPGSVWTLPTQPLVIPAAVKAELGVDHYAAFPPEWPRRIVSGWCPPGGVVLDPFGGTGTVAMMARSLGRAGISVDLSADYCRLAEWRIYRSGHADKKTKSSSRKRRPGPGALTLFDPEAVA